MFLGIKLSKLSQVLNNMNYCHPFYLCKVTSFTSVLFLFLFLHSFLIFNYLTETNHEETQLLIKKKVTVLNILKEVW